MNSLTRLRNGYHWLHARPRLWVLVQVLFVVVVLAALAVAVRDVWPEARPRLRNADPAALAWSALALSAYYLAFVVGWQWILRALGMPTSYPVALGAEMASMLAKYVPGGVWTPAARVVAMRRAGYTGPDANPTLIASILLEAGLSAIAGVLVFIASLRAVEVVDAPTWPLVLFLIVVALLLHPRVFQRLANRLLRPFGVVGELRLGWATTLGLLVYYSATWVLGGVALFFLLRAVGGEPELSAIPFLGGVAAVGAIVAVLSVLAPSGLGVREASMYGLLLAVAPGGVALGATILNRLTITVVELVLLGVGVGLWRLGLSRRSHQTQGTQEATASGGDGVESRPS